MDKDYHGRSYIDRRERTTLSQNPTPKIIPIDTGQKQPYQLEITHHDVPMRGLSTRLEGTTVVHLSDLHGGFGNTAEVHAETLRQVEAIKPDLILLTGDYIDCRTTVENYPIHEMLCQLRAPLGVYGTLGNHDHRRGPVGTLRILEKSGVHVLVNQSIRIGGSTGGLTIGAVDDLYEGKPDIPATFKDLPAEESSIVLSHNPRLIERTKDRDIFILSGHTHGGQIALKFPNPWMVCMLHLHCWQVAGWYRNGLARLYVNRGIGVTGKPYRINCPAEISVYHLKQSNE